MKRFYVFNCTRRTLLGSEVELARTVWSRVKGLLGRSSQEFPPGKGLWIIPSQGVHTIGMSFPIDVVYLDSDRRVIRVYHQLAPFRAAAVKLRARSVIELPAGTMSQSQTAVGDLLEIGESEDE